MRLALALLFTLLSACADLKFGKTADPAGNRPAVEREALYQQAREGARQARERYIATTVPPLSGSFDSNIPRCPMQTLKSWSIMHWRTAYAQKPDANRMGPSGNLTWIVCLPPGEILSLRIAISLRCTGATTGGPHSPWPNPPKPPEV
jgi:hypothetical protein